MTAAASLSGACSRAPGTAAAPARCATFVSTQQTPSVAPRPTPSQSPALPPNKPLHHTTLSTPLPKWQLQMHHNTVTIWLSTKAEQGSQRPNWQLERKQHSPLRSGSPGMAAGRAPGTAAPGRAPGAVAGRTPGAAAPAHGQRQRMTAATADQQQHNVQKVQCHAVLCDAGLRWPV